MTKIEVTLIDLALIDQDEDALRQLPSANYEQIPFLVESLRNEGVQVAHTAVQLIAVGSRYRIIHVDEDEDAPNGARLSVALLEATREAGLSQVRAQIISTALRMTPSYLRWKFSTFPDDLLQISALLEYAKIVNKWTNIDVANALGWPQQSGEMQVSRYVSLSSSTNPLLKLIVEGWISCFCDVSLVLRLPEVSQRNLLDLARANKCQLTHKDIDDETSLELVMPERPTLQQIKESFAAGVHLESGAWVIPLPVVSAINEKWVTGLSNAIAMRQLPEDAQHRLLDLARTENRPLVRRDFDKERALIPYKRQAASVTGHDPDTEFWNTVQWDIRRAGHISGVPAPLPPKSIEEIRQTFKHEAEVSGLTYAQAELVVMRAFTENPGIMDFLMRDAATENLTLTDILIRLMQNYKKERLSL